MSLLKKGVNRLKTIAHVGSDAKGESRSNGVNSPTASVSNGIDGAKHKQSTESTRSKGFRKSKHIQVKKTEQDFRNGERPESFALFKPLSMNMSKYRPNEERFDFKVFDLEALEGKTITFRARVHTIRRLSAKLVFVVFRQQTITIQGVLTTGGKEISTKASHPLNSEANDVANGEPHTPTISEQMVRAVEHYPIETIVLVKGRVRRPPAPVQATTIHDAEIAVEEIHVVARVAEHVPFTVYDAENILELDDSDSEDDNTEPGSPLPVASPAESNTSIRSPTLLGRKSIDARGRKSVDFNNAIDDRTLSQRVRLNNRIVDLRTASSQSIFRIQAGVCNLFRSYLDDLGFVEIHTPKLQGGATESGSSVFQVDYFGRPAFLAQSPQLAKQMCISADFERVYEIGPVFRAEDSNTPRHMTEYTGLDIEMALEEHYHEALDIIDGMFKNLWAGIYARYSKEIEIISKFYPHEKVVWLEKTPRIPFSEGVKMLIEDGWKDADGNMPSETEDLATRAEIRLGALVKEKFGTDYYILDKFPTSVRPFYAMPDPNDERFTNSFDIFMRGQEILTGGQRIHNPEFLEKRMKAKGVKPESMEEYMEGFRWGAPPHAGCGIGLERLVYLFLNLGNIRLATLFPRDPKSLPVKPLALHLRHPEASTIDPPWLSEDVDADSAGPSSGLQPLEKLIANYGDASNTSWLDERYQVWRHPDTGAAQGWVPHKARAIIVGDPLCAKSQYPKVISAFLDYLKREHRALKPIWLIASRDVEEYVGEKYSWRTLSVATEERVDPRANEARNDPAVARKIRHTEKEGVKHHDLPVGQHLPEDFKQRVDARVADWHKGRKGTQVHLTEIMPWIDEEHRRYFYSDDKSDTIHAIVVLHQLSPQNGYQVKFQLEFPGAPSGTIESLVLHSFQSILGMDADTKSLSFGTGASREVKGGRNISRTKISALSKTYTGIERTLGLTRKTEFREKLGAKHDPVYICYPRSALGPSGIKAILSFLEEDAK